MSATLLIVFREVLEAALIVGIVMAATRGLSRRNIWVGTGIAAGLAGAVVVAAFAEAVSSAAAGMGQEVFNATVLFLAVAMLGWHNIWMSRAGREMAHAMSTVGADVRAAKQPIYVLAVVVGVAVLREGAEVVLFLYGIAAGGGSGAGSMLAGGSLGLALGGLVGVLVYFGVIRFAGRYLFAVTGWMILFLAAGMAAQGAKYLSQAGYLEPLGQSIWDTSALLSESGALGSVLHVLVGYTARPDGIQILFYMVTLAGIGGLTWLLRTRPAAASAIASTRH